MCCKVSRKSEIGQRIERQRGSFPLPQVADLLRSHKSTQEFHPKPKLVTKLVESGLEGGGKVIVFTEYRDTVDNLMEILSDNHDIIPGNSLFNTKEAKLA